MPSPTVPIRLLLCVFTALLMPAPVWGQTHPGDVTGYAVRGKTVAVNCDTASVCFTFTAPDILRIDFLPRPASVPESSFVVIRDTGLAVPATVLETDSTLEISTSSMKAVCRKHPLRISYYDGAGQLLLAEPPGGGFSSNQTDRSASFLIGAGDHYYGTGERGTALDRLGQSFSSYNTQSGGYTSPLSTMNINVPFVASTNGYAIYFDNSYPGQFDFGRSVPSLFSYSVSGGELTCYIIAAPTIPAQLERYTWLTGRQPLPPRWALGYIQSKFGYQNQTEAVAMIQTMRRKQIPCDAIVLDLYWYVNMGDLTWNTASWPQPFTMMTDFLSQGMKTIAITEPYIVQPSANYAAAAAGGYFTTTGEGDVYTLNNWWSCNCIAALLDMTNPAAQEWWWSLHPAFFGTEMGGIWTDLGEPETHPADMVHHLGSTAKVHNIYNLLWAGTIYTGFQKMRPGQRLFNLTRSGYAGIQRYGVVPWSGDVGKDFGGLAVQPPMMLGMGMSGLAYHNSDIGGFCCGTTTPELYIRWMQYGTFCPVTRAHGTGQPTEPWGYGVQAESIATRFLRLRYSLLPYNYTLAYQNYSTGMPLARPLFFDDPSNPSFLNNATSYMWGPAFLVSPVVVPGQATKTVLLPAGTWLDFWTDKVYRGGTSVLVSTPLDRMPLFVKGGSIVPMQGPMNYSDERPLDTLFLEVYPLQGGQGSFSLYEDDGKSLAYQSGGYAVTPFSQQMSELADSAGLTQVLDLVIGSASGTYAGKLSRRVYIADIHGISQHPGVVSINDTAAAESDSYGQLRTGGRGYYYNGPAGILSVQIPGSTDSSYNVTAQNIQTTTSVRETEDPLRFRVMQNYPNPFNPTTEIRYVLPGAGHVLLRVFNLLGQEITTLVDEMETPGVKTVSFNAGALPSGVYFYRLEADKQVETKKLVLVK